MQVIFSCEDTLYQWWQAELLHHTYSKTGMTSPLTAIVAASAHPPHTYSCGTFRAANYKDRCTHFPLVCMNKPGGIAEWAALEPGSNETVFIVDPDSVFLRAVPDLRSASDPMADDEAYSEEHPWMNPDHPASRVILERHCAARFRAGIQPVGIYIQIKRATLAVLAPLWLERAVEIASDPVCREALGDAGWLGEMWGYVIAGAELGVRHHIHQFSQVTGSHSIAYPITHYCYPLLVDPAQQWWAETTVPTLWSKWSYVPWSNPPAPCASHLEGRHLLENLAELIAQKFPEPASVKAG